MAAPGSGPPTDPASEPLTGEIDLRAETGADHARALTRATAVMSMGTALSRITGFLRLAVMAWAIGGAETKLPDTYNLANTMPNIVYQLVLGEILATLFVPIFVQHLATRAKDEAWRLASTILNVAIAVAAVVSALAVLLAPWIIKIYTFRVQNPDVRFEQEQVGAFLLRLLLPQMIFYAAGAVLTGLLNAHRKFAVPMFAPILNNVIVMATFVIFRWNHPGGPVALGDLTTGDKLLLGGGTTLGVFAMTAVLWPFVRRLKDQAYSPRAFDWRNPAIRHVGNLAKYSLAYVVINQIGLWVVYALANGVTGGVTAFQSSFILYQLPYGIFAVSVFTALVPTLSEHHVHGDREAFRRDLSLGLRTTMFIIAPAAAGFVVLAHPIVRLLLEHGVFQAGSTKLFADTFLLMALGLVGYAGFQQLMRASYARQDTRTPWIVNSAAVGFNIAIAFPLFAWLDVPGLALAHTISYVFAAILGGVVLRRQLGGLDEGRIGSSALRIAVASAASAATAWLVAKGLAEVVDTGSLGGQILQVGGAVTAALILYGALATLFRLEEFRPLIRMVTGRFARRTDA
ncbi:MAG: murein biosynthesis integral membrane protein MurJ [Actinomycetota bacterium]